MSIEKSGKYISLLLFVKNHWDRDSEHSKGMMAVKLFIWSFTFVRDGINFS